MTALLVLGVVALSTAAAIVVTVFYHESKKGTAEIEDKGNDDAYLG
jgi:hypothetical protein